MDDQNIKPEVKQPQSHRLADPPVPDGQKPQHQQKVIQPTASFVREMQSTTGTPAKGHNLKPPAKAPQPSTTSIYPESHNVPAAPVPAMAEKKSGNEKFLPARKPVTAKFLLVLLALSVAIGVAGYFVIAHLSSDNGKKPSTSTQTTNSNQGTPNNPSGQNEYPSSPSGVNKQIQGDENYCNSSPLTNC